MEAGRPGRDWRHPARDPGQVGDSACRGRAVGVLPPLERRGRALDSGREGAGGLGAVAAARASRVWFPRPARLAV